MSQQRKQVFFDISLWSHRWFDNMPIEYQMAYLIIWAESDNVGVWRPHFRELNFKLKQEIDPDKFLKSLNADQMNVEVLNSGAWWLLSYLPMQVRTLTPNNRPHVSYIEDLLSHGLLNRYAAEKPGSVKFGVIEKLCDWESIEDFDEKKKARRAYKYLDSKGLIRPLQEAYKSLARGYQGSKEEGQDEDNEKAQEQGNEEAKVQEKDHSLNSLVQTENKEKANGIIDESVFGKPSLPNNAPF